jgi:hypothetical protein
VITNYTVFILGAGASCSYGFPSGEQLMHEVAAIAKDDPDNFLLLATYKIAKEEDVQINRCRAFVEALSNAGQASIDAFLHTNRNKQGFDVIGKAAIARVLLKYEEDLKNTQNNEINNDDWLSYLFKIMTDGINSKDQFIEKNNVSFITFNYDCFLEKWFYTRIKHSFGLDDTSALDVLDKIPIHHVYGMLGSFPDNNKNKRHPWVTASTKIKTIFDAEKDLTTLNNAKSLLERANVICLLGFGFHPENIALLDLISYVK